MSESRKHVNLTRNQIRAFLKLPTFFGNFSHNLAITLGNTIVIYEHKNFLKDRSDDITAQSSARIPKISGF